jgi:hypothetical protein
LIIKVIDGVDVSSDVNLKGLSLLLQGLVLVLQDLQFGGERFFEIGRWVGAIVLRVGHYYKLN